MYSYKKTHPTKETLKCKIDFKQFAREFGVSIEHYHVDNGRLTDHPCNNLKEHVQPITYCGVHAHHQNGKFEKFIRDLQEKKRLYHATHQWPDAITPHLCPYSMKMENDIAKSTPRRQDGSIPKALFARSNHVLQNDHPFGCPVYVLDLKLQQMKKIDKWRQRSRIGLYLVKSVQHARTVNLVLSIKPEWSKHNTKYSLMIPSKPQDGKSTYPDQNSN